MNNLTKKNILEIIEEAEKNSNMPEDNLLFFLGVHAFYSKYTPEEAYQNYKKGVVFKSPLHPMASAPYKDLGILNFEKLIPLLKSILCNGDAPNKKITRTVMLSEIVVVLGCFFDRATIVTIVSIIIKQGLDEICSYKI